MDCAVCRIRSAVSFCGECKVLLCEVCRQTCSHCGKTVCPEDLYKIKGGKRTLCATCLKRYMKYKAHQQKKREAAYEKKHGKGG
jgi:predicted sulfurtransferase